MRFGIATQPITPPVGVTLWGYDPRPSTWVEHALRAEALACHKSQFDEKAIADISMYFKLRSIRLGLRKWMGLADGYRALSATHMHCFPEASEWVR